MANDKAFYVITNKSGEALEIPLRKDLDKKKYDLKDENYRFSIPAGAYAQVESDLLRVFDYQDLLKEGSISLYFDPGPGGKARVMKIINKTARRIGIKRRSDGNHLVIPAFGEQEVSVDSIENFDYDEWKQLNLIKMEEPEQEEITKSNWYYVPVFTTFYGWAVILAIKAIFGIENADPPFSIWWWWPIISVFLWIVLPLGVYLRKQQSPKLRELFFQSINLIILLFLGPVGMPVFVMLFFGGVVVSTGDATPNETLAEFFRVYLGLQPVDSQSYLSEGLLARFIQVALIIILSVLPALLYYQFERKQAVTIRKRFIRNIMQMNPKIYTTDDAEIQYGNTIDEVSVSKGTHARQYAIFTTGRPILLATLVITLGWILCIWPVGPLPKSVNIAEFLLPRGNAVYYAFMGAYFFAVNMIFRRYARGDLSPKAYSHMIVRIVSAMILVWVVILGKGWFEGPEDVTNSASGEMAWYIAAFVIGVRPANGLLLIRKMLDKIPWLKPLTLKPVNHPITDLEGVSLYDEARLVEEGVESVETLAHHNLIDLLLRTGIPAARLIDLTDQAILCLHVYGMVKDDTSGKKGKKGIDILRENGIRTATDLLNVVCTLEESGNNEYKDNFYAILNPPGENKKPYRLHMVVEALKDDEWLEYIVFWRNQNTMEDEVLTDPQKIFDKPDDRKLNCHLQF